MTEDIFVGLDESDLRLLDQKVKMAKTCLRAIDDSGDLDTDFGDLSQAITASMLMVMKSAWSRRMERALDQASQNYDEDDEIGFDLSDDGEMSQADIESCWLQMILKSWIRLLDQSMLDSIFCSTRR